VRAGGGRAPQPSARRCAGLFRFPKFAAPRSYRRREVRAGRLRTALAYRSESRSYFSPYKKANALAGTASMSIWRGASGAAAMGCGETEGFPFCAGSIADGDARYSFAKN
jgi:hypothetical protein